MQSLIKRGVLHLMGGASQSSKRGANKRTSKRDFAAARVNRLTASWFTRVMSANEEIKFHLPALRARSRDLANNNEYAKNFFTKCKTNVVGPDGFILQNRSKTPEGKPAKTYNRLVEDAWRRWGKRGQCDASGRYTFHELETMYLEAVARDGGILVRKLPGFDNSFRFAIEMIDIDRLDHDLCFQIDDKNYVSMGVEFGEWDRVAAFWIGCSKNTPGARFQGGKAYQRIPGSEIIHGFMPWRTGAATGVPWLHASMVGLNHLGGYVEAAIVAARVGAAKMGFFSGPGDDYEADENEDPEDSEAPQIMEATPGEFDNLPNGYKLETWDPKYPHEQFNDFTRAALRGIAAGAGMAYSNLANDLDGLSYAGGRLGVMEERENWKMLQTWMASSFHDQIFSAWLEMALLSGQLEINFSQFNKLNAATWQPRRWKWFDPVKDIKAEIAAIESGIKTRSQVIRELGFDPYDVWEEMAEEQELIKSKGITLGSAEDLGAIMSESTKEATNDEK